MKRNLRCAWMVGALAAFAAILLPFLVFASATDGTIDSTNKYAWGDSLGWLNFGTSGGNVHVTKASITGYIWSENYGWINLAPSSAGVTNSCTGALSGYAWSENVGYVNFGGVSIDASGKFSGQAVAPGNLGKINFDCSNCDVTTDWRASVACASGGGGGSPGGGGGGGGGGGTGYFVTGTVPVATSPYNPPVSSYCDAQAKIGDFNCDGRVNIIDLSIFLYYYARSDSGAARYDLNRDGTVDFPDISIMMYHWTG